MDKKAAGNIFRLPSPGDQLALNPVQSKPVSGCFTEALNLSVTVCYFTQPNGNNALLGPLAFP